MNWEDFKNDTTTNTYFNDGHILTDIDCPKCGKKIYYNSLTTLTSDPPQYQYWCECGWKGTSFRKWRKDEQYYPSTPAIPNWFYNDYYSSTIPKACRICSNHPANGGSGICHCILGSMNIT